jgi:hypothetical protein
MRRWPIHDHRAAACAAPTEPRFFRVQNRVHSNLHAGARLMPCASGPAPERSNFTTKGPSTPTPARDNATPREPAREPMRNGAASGCRESQHET